MKLEASKRESGKASHLRKQGFLPAIVYNKSKNMTISVEHRAFDKAFRKQGQSGIIDLDIEGETVETLVKQVQMDKRRRVPQHVDFYAITRGQAVNVAIHVDYVGTAVGVRGGGQLDIKRREIKINVLPKLIPESIKVDITDLDIGEVIHISDTEGTLPEGASFMDSPELTLITVVPTRVSTTETPTGEAGETGEASETGETGEAGEKAA